MQRDLELHILNFVIILLGILLFINPISYANESEEKGVSQKKEIVDSDSEQLLQNDFLLDLAKEKMNQIKTADNFNGSESERLLEEDYLLMKKAYSEGEYRKSMRYCQKLGNYKDAEQYADLIKARLIVGFFDTQVEIETHAEKIAKDISFADTKDVLVSNDYITRGYLHGYWTTSNGMHTLELTSNGGFSTTIPVVPQAGDTSVITDGVFYEYYSSDLRNRTEQFIITPITATEVEIYAFQTKQTYTLIKRR